MKGRGVIMKDVKITGKMQFAIETLRKVNEGQGAFAREVLEYLNEHCADRADLKTFNGSLCAMTTEPKF